VDRVNDSDALIVYLAPVPLYASCVIASSYYDIDVVVQCALVCDSWLRFVPHFPPRFEHASGRSTRPPPPHPCLCCPYATGVTLESGSEAADAQVLDLQVLLQPLPRPLAPRPVGPAR
jgi:hypothetical protein